MTLQRDYRSLSIGTRRTYRLKTILFIANNRTGMSGELYLINRIYDRFGEAIRLVLYNINCYYEPSEEKGFEVINTLSKTKVEANYRGHNQSSYEYNGKSKRLLHKQIKNYFDLSKKMDKWEKEAEALLDQTKPDLIVAYDDRIIDISLFVLKYAKARGIKIVRVPFATQEDYRVTLKDRKYRLDLKIGKGLDINKLALRINPALANTLDGETRLFYSLYTIFAAKKHGILNEHPWVSGGGIEDISYCSSQDEVELINHFSPGKKTEVTGLAEDYEILGLRENRDDIRLMLSEKYGYISEKVVIFALPQLMEHDMCAPDDQHHNMDALVKIMTELYGRIYISLHPRSKKEDYSYLEDRYNAIFLEERLREVIPGADVFISTETTSTMRWAGLLGIKWFPIITEEACHSMTPQNLENFRARLLGDKTFMEPIDGDSVRDIVDIIGKLVLS